MSPAGPRQIILEASKNLLLVVLVALSLLLNHQFWMTTTEAESQPAYRPPVTPSVSVTEAFRPDRIFIGAGTEEHGPLDRDREEFMQVWDATLRLLRGTDRSRMVLVEGPEVDRYIRSRMVREPSWQAVFSAALPLDLWWEIWRGDLRADAAVWDTQAPGDLPAISADRWEMAAQKMDRICVFFDEEEGVTILAGDGHRFLAATVSPEDPGLFTAVKDRLAGWVQELPVYRTVPEEWMGVGISGTVLVPEMDVYRPAFLYLDAPEDAPWDRIRTFFFDHGMILEMEMEGFNAYTDGRGALRTYPSGGISFFAGYAPQEKGTLNWTSAVEEAFWYVDLHGGWPENVSLGGVQLKSGESLAELARRHLPDSMEEAGDLTSFLAGGPWPESLWQEAEGVGLVLRQEVERTPLEGVPSLEVWVSERGLMRFTRFDPLVGGVASESRAKPPFGAVADSVSTLPQGDRDQLLVTGVYPAYHLPSISHERTHLTAVWVVRFADGQKHYIHATTGSLLGKGR